MVRNLIQNNFEAMISADYITYIVHGRKRRRKKKLMKKKMEKKKKKPIIFIIMKTMIRNEIIILIILCILSLVIYRPVRPGPELFKFLYSSK